LILNKMDLVNQWEIERIRAWLDDHFHRLRLIETRHGNVPLEVLLSVGRFDPSNLNLGIHDEGCAGHACDKPHRHAHDHSKMFSTASFETDRPMSLEALQEVARTLPTAVYRVKGVIHSFDAPDHRAVLQVVGKRVDVSIGEEWGDHPPRTQIVAIRGAGSVDDELLWTKFQSCLD